MRDARVATAGSRPRDARLSARGSRSVLASAASAGRYETSRRCLPPLCRASSARAAISASLIWRVGVVEAGRLHSRTVRRREDDELDVSRIPSDVGLKPTLEQQAEPVQGGVERALRRPLGEAARVPSRENNDPLGTELDRV